MIAEPIKNELNERYLENRSTPYFTMHADVYLQEGKLDYAIGVLEDGIRTYPNDTIAHYLLGKAYFDKGNLDDARSEFERAVKLSPFMVSALKYLIEISEQLGLIQLEKQYREKLTNADPFLESTGSVETATPTNLDEIDSAFEVAEPTAVPAVEKEVESAVEEQAAAAEELSETVEPTEAAAPEETPEPIAPEPAAPEEEHEEESYLDSIEPDEMIADLIGDLTETDDAPAEAAPISFVKTPEEPTQTSPMMDDDLLGEELGFLSEDKKAEEPPKPKNTAVSPTLGEIYLSQGKFTEAKGIFEQLLAGDPENPKLKRKLADIEKIING